MPLDWDDGYESYPPLPNRNLDQDYKDYRIEVSPWPKNDPTATDYYWHLYFKGQKVNGGINEDEGRAWSAAYQAKFSHHRHEFLATFLWDAETMRWQPREHFMQ